MDYHQNARLTIHSSREQLARKVTEAGWTLQLAAACCNVSAKTAAKWLQRFRALGPAGLKDRSSRPHRLRSQTPLELVAKVETLRQERWAGCRIARHTQLSRATVSRILRRLKLNRQKHLDPPVPVQRYQP
ncbi:IS481 family transposase [Bryobacter aggregatus]|uniref:IS481 family transposase n=1 Tax=Bryobacter aggregatus TaxID=360054 RepID=UPI00068CDCC8|nr:IS481 family transposase [Bryobacter aggregatus]